MLYQSWNRLWLHVLLSTSFYSKEFLAFLHKYCKLNLHAITAVVKMTRSGAENISLFFKLVYAGLRLRRIFCLDTDFREKCKINQEYLIKCGHDRKHVNKIFEQVAGMTWQEAGWTKPRKGRRVCVFSAMYNPRAPDLRNIFKKRIL